MPISLLEAVGADHSSRHVTNCCDGKYPHGEIVGEAAGGTSTRAAAYAAALDQLPHPGNRARIEATASGSSDESAASAKQSSGATIAQLGRAAIWLSPPETRFPPGICAHNIHRHEFRTNGTDCNRVSPALAIAFTARKSVGKDICA